MFSLFKIQRKRTYWQIRYYVNVARFFINKIFYKATEQRESIKEHFSISKELFRLVIKSIFFAIAVLVLFKWLDRALIAYAGISNNIFLIHEGTDFGS